MVGEDRRKFTIGQTMVAIALTGAAVGLLMNQGAARSISVIVGFIGLAFLLIVITVAGLDLVLGIRCPRCERWTMARTSVHSFRDRYFRCGTCQGRCKRRFLRGWEDASDPSYDVYFARKRPENPWTALPGLGDEEDLLWSKTHLNLLVNKKRRNPNPPEQTSNHDSLG